MSTMLKEDGLTEQPYRMDRRVYLLTGSWLINVVAFSIVLPFLPLYLHGERGYSMELVGLIYPAMGLSRILSPMMTGPLVDKFGRRFFLIFGPFCRGVSYVLLAWLTYIEASLTFLMIGIFLAAFFGGFFQVASNAYIIDIVPRMHRPKAFGVLRIGMNVGWMSGPALGAFMTRSPFALIFAFTALLCFVSTLIALMGCPESDYKGAGQTKSDDRPDFRFSLWRSRSAEFGILMFICMFSLLFSPLPLFVKNEVGVSEQALGFLYTLNGLTVVLAQTLFDRFSRLWRSETRLLLGILVASVGIGWLGFSGSWLWLAIGIVIFSLGEVIVSPAAANYLSSLDCASRQGRAMGRLELVRGIGFSVGPWLGSLAWGNVQNPVLFWMTASLLGVVGGLVFLYHLRLPVRD